MTDKIFKMDNYVAENVILGFQEIADLVDQLKIDQETRETRPAGLLGDALYELLSAVMELLIWLCWVVPTRIISTVKNSAVVLLVSILNTGGLFTIALYAWHMLTLHHSELFKLVNFTNETRQSALVLGVIVPVLGVLLVLGLSYVAEGFFAIVAQLSSQVSVKRTPAFTSARVATKLLVQYLIFYLVVFSVLLIGIKLLSHAYTEAIQSFAVVLVPAAQLLGLGALFWTGWRLFSRLAATSRVFSALRAIFAIGLLLLGTVMAAEYLCLYRAPGGIKAAPLFQDLLRVLLKAHYLPDIINNRPIKTAAAPISPAPPQPV